MATGKGRRPCAGYPGYSVDARGVVYSHLVRVYRGPRAGLGVAIDPSVAVPVRPEPDGDGYLRVRLRVDGRRVWARVHMLVCTAFRGPAPVEGAQCRHLDGDRTNNRARNLAWGSALENAEDKRRHGTVLTGEACPSARLTAADVLEARRLWAEGMSAATIAAVLGVSASTVRAVARGETWRHLARAAAGERGGTYAG